MVIVVILLFFRCGVTESDYYVVRGGRAKQVLEV